MLRNAVGCFVLPCWALRAPRLCAMRRPYCDRQRSWAVSPYALAQANKRSRGILLRPKGNRPAPRARLLRERRRVAGHVAERPGGLLLDARVKLLQAGGQAGQRARARHRARQLAAVLGHRPQAARGRALLVPALRAQRRGLRAGGARAEGGRDERWVQGSAKCLPASSVRQAARLWSLRRRQCTNPRCMTEKLLPCLCTATRCYVRCGARMVPPKHWAHCPCTVPTSYGRCCAAPRQSKSP